MLLWQKSGQDDVYGVGGSGRGPDFKFLAHAFCHGVVTGAATGPVLNPVPGPPNQREPGPAPRNPGSEVTAKPLSL